VTSKPPSLELSSLDQKDAATPNVHSFGDAASRPLVSASSAIGQEVKSVERHLTAATSELAEGEIDQSLWDRAFARAKGNPESAIPLYLRVRATALHLRKREPRTETRARGSRFGQRACRIGGSRKCREE